MPDPIVVTLAAVLIEHQAKKTFGEKAADKITDALTEIVGEKAIDKLAHFLGQGERAKTLLEAFKEADACFVETCDDELLRQAIVSKPLAALPSLERLATSLPKTLDDAGLLAALRRQFADDWPRLSDEQLDHAAAVYRNCLDRLLAAKCDQLLPTIFRKIVHIESMAGELPAGQKEIKSRLVELADLARLGPREWLRPSPPRPGRPMIGRQDESAAVRKLLNPGSKAAITATMHGTPGVGKTLLAEHLAFELDDQFPGGVLLERLGAGFRDPALAAPRLKEWAGYAYGGQALEEGVAFTPEAVRALLAGRGALLVVLDDVWDIKAIRPFLDALPREACLLITTRSERLAKDLRGEVYSLDVLSDADALALLRARVRVSNDADRPPLERLAQALGNHAQALDIAGGSLDRLSRSQWPAAVAEMERQVREGSGFGELRLPGDEETESRVEAALYVSYADLPEAAQARFRALGAFAPDDSFRAEAAAGVWDCPVDQAHGQLTIFFERGLLKRLEDERWQQHSLLRAYALALLRRAGEEDAGRERHAAVHLALMRDADDRQQYHIMLPDYPQLRCAFEWASSIT